MEKQLFVTDLDGTLLNNHCALGKHSRQGIIELIEKGAHFTIATARGIVSIKEIIGDLPLVLPIICNNGAYIRDFKTQRPLAQNAFNENIIRQILFDIEEHELEPFITSTNGEQDFLTYNLVVNKGMEWFEADRLRANDNRLNPNTHFSQVFKHSITCLTIIGKVGEVKRLKLLLDKKYGANIQSNIMVNPYQSGFYWLTVQDVKTTKGNAVKWLAEKYGFEQKNVTVFGDQVNDFSMFEVAGKKISVQGGIEQIKLKADLVLGSNNDDVVVKYVQQQMENIGILS